MWRRLVRANSESAVDLQETQNGEIVRGIESGFGEPQSALAAFGDINLAWKGMHVTRRETRSASSNVVVIGSGGPNGSAIIEIDIENENFARLSLNRMFIAIDADEPWRVTWIIRPFTVEEWRKISATVGTTRFSLLLAEFAESGVRGDRLEWLSEVPTSCNSKWEALRFPATQLAFKDSAVQMNWENLRWRQELLRAYPGVNFRYSTGGGWGVFWRFPADFLGVLYIFERPVCLPIWSGATVSLFHKRSFPMAVAFPVSWNIILGISGAACNVMNQNHHIHSLASEGAWEWSKAMKLDSEPEVLLSLREECLADRARCAVALLLLAKGRKADVWNSIVERDTAFAKAMWSQLSNGDPASAAVAVLHQQFNKAGEWNSQLFLFSEAGCTVIDDADEILRYIPRPTDEWIVDYFEDEDAPSSRA